MISIKKYRKNINNQWIYDTFMRKWDYKPHAINLKKNVEEEEEKISG